MQEKKRLKKLKIIRLKKLKILKREKRLEDMDARELRYKFIKLSENYSDWYVFREILLYMNQEQLQEFWDEFEKNHPGFYDKDGNEL